MAARKKAKSEDAEQKKRQRVAVERFAPEDAYELVKDLYGLAADVILIVPEDKELPEFVLNKAYKALRSVLSDAGYKLAKGKSAERILRPELEEEQENARRRSRKGADDSEDAEEESDDEDAGDEYEDEDNADESSDDDSEDPDSKG